MNTKEILYPAALDENGNKVEAENLTRKEADHHQYRCLNCREPMIPVLKNVARVKHFRHLGDVCRHCDYLHSYAEEVFIEEYQKCLDSGLPFYLEFSVPVRCNHACVLKEHNNCKERYNRVTVDLTKEYRNIQKEFRVKTEDNSVRIPDVLLTSDDGKSLWLEICVTHEVTEAKQKQGKIIEIKISSEDDIKIFRDHKICQNEDAVNWIRLFNIGNVVIDDPMQKTPPCDKFYVYEVSENAPYVSNRISDAIPKDKTGVIYRAVLSLNWHKTHDGEGYPFPQKTQLDLNSYCELRRLTQKSKDPLLNGLVVNEIRDVTEGTYHPHSKGNIAHKKPLSVNSEPLARPNTPTLVDVNWVNLGLPSGNLWADQDLSTYETPRSPIEYRAVPSSKKNFQELKLFCKQTVIETKEGLKLIITGPNGNSITLDSGMYLLSDRGWGFDHVLNVYALIGGDYLHFIEEDKGKVDRRRFVSLPIW